MRLYHFTSLRHLPVILATGGLWRGEVPVGDGSESLRGTWFTSDPDPRGQGLDGSSANEREVRITVVLRHGDRALAHWLKFARGRLASDCIEEMMRTGGGKRKAETWYVYPSQISPSQFRAIELRREDGCYSPASPDEIVAAVPHEGLVEDVIEDFSEMRAEISCRFHPSGHPSGSEVPQTE